MNAIKIQAGQMIRGEKFGRAFKLNSIQAYMAEAGSPQERIDARIGQVFEKGQSYAWAVNPGSIIADVGGAERAQELRDNFANSEVVHDGLLYEIDGFFVRCKIQGERYSNAIEFFLIKG